MKKPSRFWRNPAKPSRFKFVFTTLHYTTQHNNSCKQQWRRRRFRFEFFDTQIWPRLNRSGKFNTRHRVCCQKWEEYSEIKRAAIAKAVLSDVFAGADNPFYYLEDFAEPAPSYLSGRQCEEEWKAGRSVYAVKVGDVIKYVTGTDLQTFHISGAKEMPPMEWIRSRFVKNDK